MKNFITPILHVENLAKPNRASEILEAACQKHLPDFFVSIMMKTRALDALKELSSKEYQGIFVDNSMEDVTIEKFMSLVQSYDDTIPVYLIMDTLELTENHKLYATKLGFKGIMNKVTLNEVTYANTVRMARELWLQGESIRQSASVSAAIADMQFIRCGQTFTSHAPISPFNTQSSRTVSRVKRSRTTDMSPARKKRVSNAISSIRQSGSNQQHGEFSAPAMKPISPLASYSNINLLDDFDSIMMCDSATTTSDDNSLTTSATNTTDSNCLDDDLSSICFSGDPFLDDFDFNVLMDIF